MSNLPVPPEFSISKYYEAPEEDENALFQNLAGYLWNGWQTSLIKQGIFGSELWNLLLNKFSKQVKDWAIGKLAWDRLVRAIAYHITSDEREYTFNFELFPRTIFGLPDGTKLVVPAKTKVAFDSFEGGSFEIIRRGTLPVYRKVEERISLSDTCTSLNFSFEDNFMKVIISSKNGDDAQATVFDFVNNFVHAFTLMSGFSISFKFISGWDEFGRSVPKSGRLQFGFTTYNLAKLKEQMLESIAIVSHWDKILQRSLEYFNHAKFLNDIRIELFMKSDEKQRFLLSDIIMSLYKSITSIIGDPAKDKDYQKRYRKFGIDYDFWKSKIDRLREIRNNWGVAHYYVSEEKLKSLNREIDLTFNITRKTILKYVDYLKK